MSCYCRDQLASCSSLVERASPGRVVFTANFVNRCLHFSRPCRRWTGAIEMALKQTLSHMLGRM